MVSEIRDITVENKQEVLELHIAKEQEGFVETPAECLAEAEEDHRYTPVGLYKDNIPVGFAMYGEFPGKQQRKRIWLDRLLIDENFQGRGLGKHFLDRLITFLTLKFKTDEIYLSVYDDNQVAIRLYEKFGFHFNGEIDGNGELVMVKEV